MEGVMNRLASLQQCTGCSACSSMCPQQCIHMIRNAEGFPYPAIDHSRCTDCGLCEKVCPIVSEDHAEKGYPLEVWGAKALDDAVREKSSSGGIFSLLANLVLGSGGYVFGAAYTEDFRNVNHRMIHSMKEVQLLRGSKYMQSNLTGGGYQVVKEKLDAGAQVLFSGTPCQIKGLMAYLQREYDNLLTVEIICHGVPSAKLWQKYIDFLRSRKGRVFERVNFRDKCHGWKMFGLKIEFNGQKSYYRSHIRDSYMQMFLQNLSLRPSCYRCQAKEKGSGADLTLGDFWGVRRIQPELNDDKGVSIVFVNSVRGSKAFHDIQKELACAPVTYEKAVEWNLAASQSVREPALRSAFFRDMDRMTFPELAGKYVKRAPLKDHVRLLLIIILRKAGLR